VVSILTARWQAQRRGLEAALCLCVSDSIAGKTGEKQRAAGRGGEVPGAECDVTAESGWEPWTERGMFAGQLAACPGQWDLVRWW